MPPASSARTIWAIGTSSCLPTTRLQPPRRMASNCHASSSCAGSHRKMRVPAGLAVAAFCTGQALAQSATPMSNTDLAKEAENPLTLVTTLPLRYEPEFNDTADGTTKATYLIDEAVLPFRLNDDWALITRTKIEGISQPPKKADGVWRTGLGNG